MENTNNYFRYGYDPPPLWFSLEVANTGNVVVCNDLVLRLYKTRTNGNFLEVYNSNGSKRCYEGDVVYKDDKGEMTVYTYEEFKEKFNV